MYLSDILPGRKGRERRREEKREGLGREEKRNSIYFSVNCPGASVLS